MQDIDPGVEIVDDLDDVTESDEPVLVMFYADWCGFCRAFAPDFRQRIQALDVDAVAANISSNSDPRWKRYDIDAVPTLIAFQGGNQIARADSRPGRGLEARDVDEVAAQIKA